MSFHLQEAVFLVRAHPDPDPCPGVRIKVKVHPCLDLKLTVLDKNKCPQGHGNER
jgi:hypothetical protein